MARELVRRPDLLLLDEPTNHLDLPGVVWLERLLLRPRSGIWSRPRPRSSAVADEILEVSRVYPGGAFRVAAGYDDFADSATSS